MQQRPRKPVIAVLLMAALAAVALASACTEPSITWVDDGAAYSRGKARAIAESVDAGTVADRPTADATELRHEALSDLRMLGDKAAQAANLLTSTFDPATRAVPLYVEAATVEDRDVIIMVEAWGPKSGSLEFKRTWILDASTGDVLDASSAR